MWLSMELIVFESNKAREEIDSCTRCYCIVFYHRFHTPYFFGSIRVKKRSLGSLGYRPLVNGCFA